ncbi:PhzF family phenazine biosynthesis protein, partial [Escherichia coli]|nr:PhzF family phenazine biosynthesis protein [Escherichia coli]
MQQYPFHLVNVFAETHFGGNPLAVFPHADGLND